MLRIEKSRSYTEAYRYVMICVGLSALTSANFRLGGVYPLRIIVLTLPSFRMCSETLTFPILSG